MQVIVTSNEQWKFDKEVTAKLDAGYKVVPGTMTIAVASSSQGTDTYYTSSVIERYAVILEK